MKRYSEVVLSGHPDKFCDLIADRIIREIYKTDESAYSQIEVSVWSDIIFLSGAVVSNCKFTFSIMDVIIQTGMEIGYTKENHIDVTKYQIKDHLCWIREAPEKWTHHVNDQSIVVGYAGYNELTHFLPPEHFLCWYLREAITTGMQTGSLTGHGPDGKILVIINEEYSGWKVEKILVTMQQKGNVLFTEFAQTLSETIFSVYCLLKKYDKRWIAEWDEINFLLNPNGPFTDGGSSSDNGQTGRKLVMDFYGPRIPIGGGALCGKHLTHIDRLAAMMARKFAVSQVVNGAKETLVRVCFAPDVDSPIGIDINSDKKLNINAEEFFNFQNMRSRIKYSDIDYDMAGLGSFYNNALSFNESFFKN